MSNIFNSRPRRVQTQEYSRPYVAVEIEAIDHNNVIVSPINDWKSDSGDTGSWLENGIRWVGLTREGSSELHNLTKTITVDEPGLYRIQLLVQRAPFSEIGAAYADVSMDGILFAHENLYADDRFINTLDLGLIKIEEGEHEFTITTPKYSFMGALFIKKVRKFYADTEGYGNFILGSNIKFTQNSVNSINTFSVEIIMENGNYPHGFRDQYSWNGYTFYLGDSINIYVGETGRTTSRKFGGYITTPSLNDDETIMTLEGIDRLMDFTNAHLFKDLNIGGVATSSGESDSPQVELDNIYEAIKYICQSVEHPLDCSTVDEIISQLHPPEVGLSVDFSNDKTYNAIKAINMTKSRSNISPMGNVLTLQNMATTDQQYVVLWENTNNPIDLAAYNVIEFSYFIKEETIITETTSEGDETSSAAGGGSSYVENEYQTANPNNKTPKMGNPPSNCDVISGTGFPGNQCAGIIPWKKFPFAWKKYCPVCGSVNKMAYDGIGIYCTVCDVDWCPVSGFGTTCVDANGNEMSGSLPVGCPAGGKLGCVTRLTPASGGSSTTELKTGTSTTDETETTDPASTPFLFDVEITFYTEDDSTPITNQITFTGQSGDAIIGAEATNLDLSKWSLFSYDILEVLATLYPDAEHFYLTRIAFTETMNSGQAAGEDIDSRKMSFATLKIHDGTATNPVLYEGSGKMQMDVIKSIADDFGYVIRVDYGSERRFDSLKLYKKGSTWTDFKIIEGKNLIDITNITDTPKDSLKTSFTEVYTPIGSGNTDSNDESTVKGMVQELDLNLVGHVGIHDSFESLESVSTEYYARTLARINLQKNSTPAPSFTATVTDGDNLDVGALIPCDITRIPKLSGIKIAETVECNYSRDKAAKLRWLAGLDRADPKYSEAVNALMKDLRDRQQFIDGTIYKNPDSAILDFVIEGYTVATSPSTYEEVDESPSGPNLTAFYNATGVTLTDAQSLRDWVAANFTWTLYWDPKNSNKKILAKWKQDGHVYLNCCDMIEFCRPLLLEMGYSFEFRHSAIQCTTNYWTGHAYGAIWGEEYGETKTIYDPTGFTYGKGIGTCCCSVVGSVTVNPAYLVAAENDLY